MNSIFCYVPGQKVLQYRGDEFKTLVIDNDKGPVDRVDVHVKKPRL